MGICARSACAATYVRVGGHRIHYLAGGKGPPLLVVHGVASRADDGAPIYRELMRTHRVYALDLLGYGDSDRPLDSDYSVTTQAEIVRGFMDAVGLREADVMGVSMGGWVALKVAAEHPERVRRLVLVSSGGLQFDTTLTPASFSPTTLDELRATLAMQTDRASIDPDVRAARFPLALEGEGLGRAPLDGVDARRHATCSTASCSA